MPSQSCVIYKFSTEGNLLCKPLYNVLLPSKLCFPRISNWWQQRSVWFSFLDQELSLISYRHSSCSSSSSTCWNVGATVFKKPRDSVVSNQIGMIGVRFLMWCHNFKMAPMAAMTSFHAEKCLHLVYAYVSSAWRYAAAYAGSGSQCIRTYNFSIN